MYYITKRGKTTVEKLMVILLIITFDSILVFFVTNPFAETLQKTSGTQIEKCKQSIDLMHAASTTKKNLLLSEVDIPFECETNWYGDIEITENTEEKQKEEIIDQIAPLLSDCWYQFYEGTKDPFGKFRITTLQPQCFLCSQFKINYTQISEDPNIFTQFTLTSKDITDYFKENLDSRSKETYSTYFKEAFPNNEVVIKKVNRIGAGLASRVEFEKGYGLNAETIPQREYAIIMMSLEAESVSEMFGQKHHYLMFMMPYDNFENLPCNRIEKKDPNRLEE